MILLEQWFCGPWFIKSRAENSWTIWIKQYVEEKLRTETFVHLSVHYAQFVLRWGVKSCLNEIPFPFLRFCRTECLALCFLPSCIHWKCLLFMDKMQKQLSLKRSFNEQCAYKRCQKVIASRVQVTEFFQRRVLPRKETRFLEKSKKSELGKAVTFFELQYK